MASARLPFRLVGMSRSRLASQAQPCCHVRPGARVITLSGSHKRCGSHMLCAKLTGTDRTQLAKRASLYENARTKHPERWSGKAATGTVGKNMLTQRLTLD